MFILGSPSTHIYTTFLCAYSGADSLNTGQFKFHSIPQQILVNWFSHMGKINCWKFFYLVRHI